MDYYVKITERKAIHGPSGKLLDDDELRSLDGIAETIVRVDANGEKEAIYIAKMDYKFKYQLSTIQVEIEYISKGPE